MTCTGTSMNTDKTPAVLELNSFNSKWFGLDQLCIEMFSNFPTMLYYSSIVLNDFN